MKTFDIIYFIIITVILIAFIVLWYFRMRELGKLPYLFSNSDFKSIISHALRQLNIKVKWDKEGGCPIVHYSYQGGNFNLSLEKNSPFARLTFLYFFKTDIDNLETVRVVCNLCNINADACRMVYTIDTKKGEVDVHLLSVLPVNEKGMKDILERVMSDAFRWQSTFISKYKYHKKQDEKAANEDAEKALANLELDVQLIREQEMTHQDAGPDWHESADKQFTMSSLISAAMGLTDIIPISLTLTIDGETSTIENPDEILSYKISEPLISGNQFVHDYAIGKLDYYDPRDPITARNLMFDFEQSNDTADTLYYRITLALAPVSINDKRSINSEQHQKQMTSVLLGYDLTDSKQRLAHFRYVRKEAMAKQKAGKTDQMTDEEKLLAKIQDQHLGYNYYHGRDLYLHKRFYEALTPLTDAYRTVTHMYDHHDRDVLELLDEIAYFIGCCYMGLHQYDRAAYYLQLTIPTTHKTYTEAYVNCLVNSDDFRAMDVLTGLQGTLETMLDNMEKEGVDVGDDEDDDELNYSEAQSSSYDSLVGFLNFVKRRRAYLLVNKGKYREAERLLKQLLDDPDNSDFALSELAYIQKNK